MKYKVGDKVRIKEGPYFHKDCDKSLNSFSPKRVVTIKIVHCRDFWIEESIWRFEEYQIEGLVCEPISNRFEILDL